MKREQIIKFFKNKWWAIKLLYAQIIYGFPAKKLKIIGVTGTNGKTTTATLLYNIARGLGYKAGFIGTTGTEFDGKPIDIKRKIPTTPDSVTLTKIFKQMVRGGCEYVFMEVSSHAVDQKRIAGISFAGGIFTNLTQDHLDYHKSMENYFKAKKKFFELLPESSFALSNADDAHGLHMLEGVKAKHYLYGIEKDADIKGEIVKMDFDGLEMKVGQHKIKAKLLAKFNAYNILSIWSASLLLDFDAKKVLAIMENLEPPAGRFTYVVSPSGVLGIVDYAHSPDALEKVIETARGLGGKTSKVITVFGCGGDRDTLKRRIMGKIGAELSDVAIFTSDNPRNEDPDKIIEQMKTDLTMDLLQKVKTIANRREAIAEAVKIAQKGDIILLAGKGHETYQEIKGVKHPFNDMEELEKNFAEYAKP